MQEGYRDAVVVIVLALLLVVCLVVLGVRP